MEAAKKLLVGYDGSEHSNAAVEDLQRAGLPTEIEAIVLTVADVFLPPAPESDVWESSPIDQRIRRTAEETRARALKALEEAEMIARRGAGKLQELFPSWTVRAEAAANWPAWGIILKAEQERADLVVIGSGKHSVRERIQFGSISRKVVETSACSVRVGRRSPRLSEPTIRLVIGLDGSPDSDLAVEAVSKRLWPDGSEARLITVIDNRIATLIPALIPRLARWSSPADPAASQAWIERMMKAASEKLQSAGLTISSEITKGNPSRRLLDAASEWKADCIFVGARGLSGIERFLIGSVADSVVARASCSVEVVRPQATG